MSKPWHRTVEFPRQLKLFGGIDCPLCGEEKSFLVGKQFAEGIAMICEECRRQYSVHSDVYVFPTVDEFRKRMQKGWKNK